MTFTRWQFLLVGLELYVFTHVKVCNKKDSSWHLYIFMAFNIREDKYTVNNSIYFSMVISI